MATITGKIITDAVVNMKAALDTQIATWEVSEVHRYNASNLGKRGNHIAIEFVTWDQSINGFGDTKLTVDHTVTLRIWYVQGVGVRQDSGYDSVYDAISDIVQYLIENPRPNGYGELLLNNERITPVVGTIETTAGSLLAGNFAIRHTLVGKQHTLTLAP